MWDFSQRQLMLAERIDQLAGQFDSATAEQAEQLLADVAASLQQALSSPSAEAHRTFAAAGQLLSSLRRDVVTVSRVEALLACAQFAYVSGQPFAGLDLARMAVECAQRLEDAATRRRALMFHGILLADTGNIATAVELYAEALEIACSMGDARVETSVWVNLGAALVYAGQLGDAAACFDRVVTVAGADPSAAALQPLALTNLATIYWYLEEHAKGLRSIKAAIDSAGEPKSATDRLHRVTAECCYSRLLLEVDGLDRARERCELAKRYARESRSERAELQATLVEGLCEVHAGLIDVGISRLAQALDRARVLKSALRDALLAMVKAQEVAGKPDVALVYLRELMMHTKKTQQENALRHHRLHLENLARQQQEASEDSVMERHEQTLRGKLAEQVAQQELMRSRIEMLERLAVTAELRDDSTGEHSYRVGRLASLLGREFGCDDQTCFMLDLAARLHDIGKIGINHQILMKPSMLTEAERIIIRKHPEIGAQMLAKSSHPGARLAATVAATHHEWWDGTGYPNGLRHGAIPIETRIVALADVYDVLTTGRPYKQAWPHQMAVDELRFMGGRQFDPELVELFVEVVDAYVAAYGEAGDAAYRSALQDCSLLKQQGSVARLLEAAA